MKKALLLTCYTCGTTMCSYSRNLNDLFKEQLHRQDIIGYHLYTFKIYEFPDGKDTRK